VGLCDSLIQSVHCDCLRVQSSNVNSEFLTSVKLEVSIVTDLFGAGNVECDCPISLMLGCPLQLFNQSKIRITIATKLPESLHVYCYCQPGNGGCDCNQFEAGVFTAAV